MKTLMSKQLYNFTQDKLQKNRQGGQIKNSALATRLYEEYNFGQFDFNKKSLIFTLQDILVLSEEIQSRLSIDIRQDPYPSKEDRISSAKKFRNEKDNSYAVSKDFILVNSLSHLNVNHSSHKISPLTSLGSYIRADDIMSVEHSAIVLVENLAVMANLSLININSMNIKINNNSGTLHNIPYKEIDLTQALWLYRGDIKPQQTTNTSYEFFRRFKDNTPLICFSDLDPKGIEIALTCNADYWLTLDDTNEITMPLSGDEQEWYKQSVSVNFLNEQLKHDIQPVENTHCWQTIFNILLSHKKTLKQEHMLTHKLPLRLININAKNTINT
tara:strand:+ start:1565 stop:2551 length:987 start_codon:yes stop_codon:yes gene_type:complete